MYMSPHVSHLKMALYCRANVTLNTLLNNSYCKFTTSITRFKAHKRHSTAQNAKRVANANANANANSDYYIKDVNIQTGKSNDFLKFDNMVKVRRHQAAKSILVQVDSVKSQKDLQSYCSSYGKISSLHHYKVSQQNDQKHFILVEFDEASSVTGIISTTKFLDSFAVPMRTSMFWFSNRHRSQNVLSRRLLPLSVTNGICVPKDEDIAADLLQAKGVSEQMVRLHRNLQLSDIEIRLRFFTICQIEQCFSGILPDIFMLPFGSSVNSFGKHQSDLDVALSMEGCQKGANTSRLKFHAKSMRLNDQQDRNNVMMTLARIMKYFVPGIHQVETILQARVPIIKFKHLYTGVECDLAISNFTAVYMSELLYIYGEMDPRVRPLVCTIRHWADIHKLTNVHPGRWITNFSLTLLVLFYLQQTKILPNVDQLRSFATEEDVRLADQVIDCTFLRDLRKLRLYYSSKSNDSTLEELLRGFYEFYGSFKFRKHAISLRTGSVLERNDSAALYICNPLETSLNVSKNVSSHELHRLIQQIEEALRIMDQNESYLILPKLLQLKCTQSVINLSTLYNENEDNTDEKHNADETSTLSSKSVDKVLESDNNDVHEFDNSENEIKQN